MSPWSAFLPRSGRAARGQRRPGCAAHRGQRPPRPSPRRSRRERGPGWRRGLKARQQVDAQSTGDRPLRSPSRHRGEGGAALRPPASVPESLQPPVPHGHRIPRAQVPSRLGLPIDALTGRLGCLDIRPSMRQTHVPVPRRATRRPGWWRSAANPRVCSSKRRSAETTKGRHPVHLTEAQAAPGDAACPRATLASLAGRPAHTRQVGESAPGPAGWLSHVPRGRAAPGVTLRKQDARATDTGAPRNLGDAPGVLRGD